MYLWNLQTEKLFIVKLQIWYQSLNSPYRLWQNWEQSTLLSWWASPPQPAHCEWPINHSKKHHLTCGEKKRYLQTEGNEMIIIFSNTCNFTVYPSIGKHIKLQYQIGLDTEKVISNTTSGKVVWLIFLKDILIICIKSPLKLYILWFYSKSRNSSKGSKHNCEQSSIFKEIIIFLNFH